MKQEGIRKTNATIQKILKPLITTDKVEYNFERASLNFIKNDIFELKYTIQLLICTLIQLVIIIDIKSGHWYANGRLY